MKAKRVKAEERPVPHARVFMYFIGFETIANSVLSAVGQGRVRKGWKMFHLPVPVTTSEQLQDIEMRLRKHTPGNPEIILTSVNFMGEDMIQLTPEQVAVMEQNMADARARQEAMQAIKDGVQQAVAEANKPSAD